MEIESVSCVTPANVISNRLLSRKQRKTLAVSHIFDGEKEGKLIALACSKPLRRGMTSL